jgi:hypothetical protein
MTNNYDVCTVSRLGRYDERNVGDREPATDTQKVNTDNRATDNRAITTDQIRELINKLENLTSNQKQKLTALLMKHQGNITNKPVKCRRFEYTLQVQGQLPKSTYSRPLPFELRTADGEEIRQLMKDNIVEESHSAY